MGFDNLGFWHCKLAFGDFHLNGFEARGVRGSFCLLILEICVLLRLLWAIFDFKYALFSLDKVYDIHFLVSILYIYHILDGVAGGPVIVNNHGGYVIMVFIVVSCDNGIKSHVIKYFHEELDHLLEVLGSRSLPQGLISLIIWHLFQHFECIFGDRFRLRALILLLLF